MILSICLNLCGIVYVCVWVCFCTFCVIYVCLHVCMTVFVYAIMCISAISVYLYEFACLCMCVCFSGCFMCLYILVYECTYVDCKNLFLCEVQEFLSRVKFGEMNIQWNEYFTQKLKKIFILVVKMTFYWLAF